jgi:hypothetical protein
MHFAEAVTGLCLFDRHNPLKRCPFYNGSWLSDVKHQLTAPKHLRFVPHCGTFVLPEKVGRERRGI